MAEVEAKHESEKIEKPIILPGDREGEEDSRESLKSIISSKDEQEIINEMKAIDAVDEKGLEYSESLETNKIVRKMKERTESRKSMEYTEDPERQRLVDFLRAKNFSEILIRRGLVNGLDNGFDILLRALGITDQEMKQYSWEKRIDSAYPTKESMETKRKWSSSDELMSPDNLYLKKHCGDILVRAMKEIVKRKPSDPVEFLGQFLIHYQVCEERENRRKEFEAELIAQRKLLKEREAEQESEIVDYDERPESFEGDSNYEEYESDMEEMLEKEEQRE